MPFSAPFSVAALRAALEELPAAARLWIAYSGGLDSHVLLHAAARLGLPFGQLQAVHLDHGLHPDAAAWAEHCRAVCAGLGVPLTVQRLGVRPAPGDSLEATARAARYAALAALLAPSDWVATAHHQDDQAETLLLALLRGGGVHGLAAMPRHAPLGAGMLVRPLLDWPRAALAEYAAAHHLRWLTDPSNADLQHDRNLLRLTILPRLRRRWPALADALARTAGHCAEAAGLLDGLADELLPALAGVRPATLSVARLRALAPERARLVLRRWISRQGFRPPSADRLRRVLTEVLPAAPDRSPLVAWAGCEVRRYRDDLFALAPLPLAPPPALPVPWLPGTPFPLPLGLGSLHWSGQGDPPGDLAVGLGPGGGRRCKRWFQTVGLPPWLRPFVPRLWRGETLVGLVGLAGEGLLVRWSGHPWVGFGLSEGVASGPASAQERG